MKYLIITNHSYMLYQFRLELLEKLQESGEVVISMPFVGHQEDFAAKGFKCIETQVDRRGINPIKDLKLIGTYRKILKQEKPDKVITYSIKPNIYAGLLCAGMNIPYFVNVQGLGTAFQSRAMAAVATAMYKAGVKKARTVLFENQANADEFVKRGIISKEKELVLNGAGVNLEKYKYQPYPSEEQGIHILYLGRIMREKGMDETFAAMKAIKEKYGDRVVFDVVGFFEDEYESAVNELADKGVIRFHGFQEDPKPFYANAHAVVLASYHEGMSNVLLEAAATGRALITTDIPGCREAVEDGVTGFLCRKQDTASLISAMDKFLSLSAEQRKAMGTASRRKIESEFDKQIIVQKITKRLIEG